MKYRRATLKERITDHFNRGVYGMGLFVLVISLTQGLSGVLGVIILMLLISALMGLVVWVARTLEGLVSRRGIE